MLIRYTRVKDVTPITGYKANYLLVLYTVIFAFVQNTVLAFLEKELLKKLTYRVGVDGVIENKNEIFF